MLRPSVSVIQIAGSGANVRQPVLSGSPPAAKERTHAREDAGHERDSSIHLHPHADNHPSPKASRRALERPDPDLASFGTEHPDRPQTVPAGGPLRLACILVVSFSRSESGTSCAWAAAFSAFSSDSVSFGITPPAELLRVIGNVCRTVLLLPDTSTKRSGIAQSSH